MASITRNGESWRDQVYVKGTRESATFRTKREAMAWAFQREIALNESARQLKAFAAESGPLSCRINVSLAELIGNRNQIYRGSGVYILFDDATPVYVGKSKNVIKRVAHPRSSHSSASISRPALSHPLP